MRHSVTASPLSYVYTLTVYIHRKADWLKLPVAGLEKGSKNVVSVQVHVVRLVSTRNGYGSILTAGH